MPDPNPFVEFRDGLDVYRHAIDQGMSDDDYRTLVTEADERISDVAKVGFTTTPIVEFALPAGEPTNSLPVIAKVETGSVGGSHKARHLFGLLLRILIDERTATTQVARTPRAERPPLAIASCGNAALGAAIVARAAERELRVFVPTDANPKVVEALIDYGATIAICPRTPGVDGDPCVAEMEAALAEGAEPFTVQGPICPDSIDGARTLGLELAAQLDDIGAEPDAIYIQIGGGALATAVMDGLGRAWPDRPLPRLHPVQASAAHPYAAAWNRFASHLLARLDRTQPSAQDMLTVAVHDAIDARNGTDQALDLQSDLDASDAMEPWTGTPQSVASGILDDITYDWKTVVSHQVATGGWPILVDEPTFGVARDIAADATPRTEMPPPDETGAAGLAGLLTHLVTSPETAPRRPVVLLTGAIRS